MKKLTALLVIGAVALVGNWFTPMDAEAIPPFARQTGVPCLGCHYIHIPILGPFGREFKAGAYTQTSADLMEDDDLSIVAVPGFTVLQKMRYFKTSPKTAVGSGLNESGTDRGNLEFADEDVIWMGGRVSENIGMVSEFAGGSNVLKFIYAAPMGEGTAGLSIYRNDGHGPGASMELWNTGGVKNHRLFERRHGSYASEVLGGVGIGNAAGVHVYYNSDLFFLNVGLWAPVDGKDPVDSATELSTYVRLAVTPKIWEGVDFMVGVQIAAGETKTCTGAGGDETGCAALTTSKTESTRIDTQALFDFNGMTTILKAEYLTNPNDANSVYNTGANDEKGWDIAGLVAINTKLSVGFGYADYTDVNGTSGNDMQVTEIGMNYNLAQNAIFLIEYQSFGGDARTNDSDFMVGIEYVL